MQPALTRVYDTTNTKSMNSNNLLSLPIPHITLSETLQTLISTYFLQVITALSTSSVLPHLLDEASPGLIEWLQYLPSLPLKHKDSTLTRIYTLLAKSTAVNTSPPGTYSLRIYALRCLSSTSPGTVAPNTFWDQAVKFAVAFVKTEEKDEVTRQVMRTFPLLVKAVEGRKDRGTWLEGKGFIGFCEYWMAFAKRVSSIYINSFLRLLNPIIYRPGI